MDYISSNFPVSGLPIQQFCMSRISQFLVHIFSSFACPGVKKKNFSVELESLRLEFIVGKIFPQMLYLGREPTKTEHLGKKNFPSGSRVFKTRVLLRNFFFFHPWTCKTAEYVNQKLGNPGHQNC